MKTILSLVVIFGVLSFSDASYGMARKYTVDEQTRRTVHGAAANLDAGRVDVADLILQEGKRVIPAPKYPIAVNPMKDKRGKTVVILPAKLNNKLVVARDSQEFLDLLQDREVKKQYERSNKELVSIKARMEGTIKRIAEEKKTAEDKANQLAADLEKEKNRSISLWEMIKIGIGICVGLALLIVIAIVSWIISLVVGWWKKICGKP